MKPDTYYAKLCKKETKPKFDQAALADQIKNYKARMVKSPLWMCSPRLPCGKRLTKGQSTQGCGASTPSGALDKLST